MNPRQQLQQAVALMSCAFLFSQLLSATTPISSHLMSLPEAEHNRRATSAAAAAAVFVPIGSHERRLTVPLAH